MASGPFHYLNFEILELNITGLAKTFTNLEVLYQSLEVIGRGAEAVTQ